MPNAQLLTTGELLRRYRRAAGLTQDELAERAAVSSRSISDIERGISSAPHRGTLDGLADALGLMPEERDLLQASARAGRILHAGGEIPPRVPASSIQHDESRWGTLLVWEPRRLRRVVLWARSVPMPIRLSLSLAVVGLVSGAVFGVKHEMNSPATVSATRSFVPWQVTQDKPVRIGPAQGLRIGPAGNVYAATVNDAGSRSPGVWKLGPSGQVLAHWGRYGRTTIYGGRIALDSQRNIFVVDVSHDRVVRISSDGQVVTSWGSHGSTPGKFEYVGSIAVDGHGHVFVGDETGRIQKFTETGKLLEVWPNCGSRQLSNCQPNGMAADAQGNLYVADLAIQGVRKISPTGRTLTMWGGFGSDATQFAGPTQIDFDAVGNLFVVDVFNGRIHKFSPTGTPRTWWGATLHGLSCPLSLGISRHSEVYVGACNPSRILKFSASGIPFPGWKPFWAVHVPLNAPSSVSIDPQGHLFVVTADGAASMFKISRTGQVLDSWPAAVLGAGQAHAPTGATVDSAGNVYVVDALSNRVLKVSSSRKVIESFGGEGSGPGQLENPSAAAVDRTGNVYVSDTGNRRVVKFSAAGSSLGQWDTAPDGTALFLQPEGITVDAHDNVYVADRGKHAILKLSTGGTLLSQWGGSDRNALSEPIGIAVDSRGLIYVTDAGDSRVKLFSSDGKPVAQWGRNGSQPGEFNRPNAITVDRHGTVYVADTGNNRIQKLATR